MAEMAGAKEHRLGQMTGEETASLLEAFQRMGYYNPDPPELMRGLKEVSLKDFKKGHLLIRPGEEAQNFYIIHKGKVAVTKQQNGKEVKVAELGPYAAVGEMALVENRPRSSTVTVLEDSRLFHLTKGDFQFLMDSCEVFRQIIDTLVAERNRYNAQISGD